ncbi:ribosomal small subunit Rsm22 [Reticulibacter mediterranei]|uniref:Ribosomal small subunit Rsm22 n=1 Tax=Reticulibacter mediterranei TaxID=2778369 RepID=A0A8J3N7I7_9CHLR|nr:small ribosomal subunit Rsm22 family protein [Reticulibacter mediterranei]GHO97202.1 ribosomal small subunit Rsm22 [Reticulibacter mediterranei]
MLSLPYQLETAIESTLQNVPASKWKSVAKALSERYRTQRTGKESALARGFDEALGYAAIILPAAYAQLSGAMTAVRERVPGWQPVSMLDIGSGPGTALWAATEQWPTLQKLTAWERESAFIDLGRQLARTSEKQALTSTSWQRVVLDKKLVDGQQAINTVEKKLAGQVESYDLVVFGHVLNELPEALRKDIVALAWQRCSGVLLIVEPGTSAAFPIVKAMRDYLLDLDARTLAPCAHDRPCSLLNDWCHFPQRLERPSFQRRAKEASAGWEESKFSYAAMARFPADTAIWGRLIHQPHKQKNMVSLAVSSTDGILDLQILKKHREAFRQASDYGWGEVVQSRIKPPK